MESIGQVIPTTVHRGNVEVVELKGNNRFERFCVSISTTEVIHTAYTLAYRFDADGKSIVISGDLSYSEGLISLSKNADFIVMDASEYIRKRATGMEPSRRDRKHIETGDKGWPKPHASLVEIAQMAEQETYGGEIIFGKDLLEIVP